MKIDILCTDTRWSQSSLRKVCQRSFKLALSSLSVGEENFEISVLACNNDEIKDLNRRFRGHNSATNILSWPETDFKNQKKGKFQVGTGQLSKEGDVYIFLGNIAISYDQCSLECVQRNIKFGDHVTHLLLHGCLHLLGYTHKKIVDAKVMEKMEVKLLDRIGIKNPYYENEVR